MPALAVLLAVGYITAFKRGARARNRVSRARALWFLLGCAIAVGSTAGPFEWLASTMLTGFVFQQLTLMMIVAPLLVLGSPGQVLLKGLPHHGPGGTVLRSAIAAQRSLAARIALHPALVTPLLLLTLFGLYPTGLANLLLQQPFTRALLQLFLLTVGVLLATPLMSTDPLPRRTSYIARLIDTLLEMQIHAAFGLTLIFSSRIMVAVLGQPAQSMGIQPIQDQQFAGAAVWTYGELPVLVILIMTLSRWQRQDTKAARRAAKTADREGDPELEEYNAYLRSLQR